MSEMGRGRPRDIDIDRRVLDVARQHLAERGYEAMSLVAVAAEAGTTRQALYRRWHTKADLAAAAVASLVPDEERHGAGADPFTDLVAALKSFQQSVNRPDGLSMVGTMLHHATDADLVRIYRQRVVAPRRKELKAVLQRAQAAGVIDAGADVDIAVAMLTGNWYARALGGEAVPSRWAVRTARLVWRALGGTPPV